MKRMLLKSLFLPILATIWLVSAHAQQTAQKFVIETDYLLYLPQGYTSDTTTRWPVMLFLHGAGESGTDIEKVKVHGPPKLIAEGRQYPFIVVSPQAQRGWRKEILFDLLQSIFSDYRVDRDRVYLTGLSMGGFGTWDLAMEHPETFAAIVPICGGGDSSKVWTLRHMPVWCFHGAKDNIVPLSASQNMVDALKKYNPTVKFTVYPEATHDSWTETYANESVYEWLLAQRRFVFKETSVNKKLLEDYAGTYLWGNDTLDLVVSGDKLDVHRKTQKAFELKPTSDTEFFIDANWPESVIFQRDTKKKVTSFLVLSNNNKIIFKKIVPKGKTK